MLCGGRKPRRVPGPERMSEHRDGMVRVTEENSGRQATGARGARPTLLPPLRVAGVQPRLSADQQAAVDLPQGSGPVILWGAPGTGKSTALVEAAVRRVDAGEVDPERVLVLAPSRVAATRLRDSLTARLGRSLGTTPARSWAAYAFDVIRRAHAEGAVALDGPPRLLSGPEQDQVIKELLDGARETPGTGITWPPRPGSRPAHPRFPAGGPGTLRPPHRARRRRGGPGGARRGGGAPGVAGRGTLLP